ncbi:MAG: methionyl-tRNA formyltransferase, partial [Rubrivivax sp.]
WEGATSAGGAVPGTLLARGPQGLHVVCAQGSLLLKALQAPGGRRLPVEDFLRSPASQPWQAGVCLESPPPPG